MIAKLLVVKAVNMPVCQKLEDMWEIFQSLLFLVEL